MTKISISTEVLAQELDGETVLLDLASETYFGLDVVGTRVWQLLNEGMELAELMETMLEEYAVEQDVLQKDVDELLARLSQAGLISIA